MMMLPAEDYLRAQHRAHARPEDPGETRVAVRDEHVGQPHVAKHRADEVARRLLGGGGLEGRNQPHAPGQEVDVHLQKVLAGARDGQLEEVEADAPAATRGNGERCSRPSCGRWSALTR